MAPSPTNKRARVGAGEDSGDEAQCKVPIVTMPDLMGLARTLKTRNMIRDTITELTSDYGGDRAKVLDVTLGDPTKYGAPFLPPEELTEAMIAAVRSNNHNGYVAAYGTEEARRAVAKYVGNPDPDKIFITAGCSSAIDMAFRSLAGPGTDIILVPSPGFPLYETLCVAHGINSKRYSLDKDRDWEVDLDRMKCEWHGVEQAKCVKCVVVTNPSNPCGSVYSRKHLREVLVTIRSLFPNAVVVADEVYEEVVFGEGAEFHAMGSFHDEGQGGEDASLPPVVTVSSIAKGYCAPGWRVGWISARGPISPDFAKGVRNLSMTTMGATTLLQAVLPAVLVRGSHHPTSLAAWKRRVASQLSENASRFVEALSVCSALEVYSLPRGAMYCYFGLAPSFTAGMRMTPFEFAKRLLEEEGVLILPGTCFGSSVPSFRASIAVPLEILMTVAERLKRFCERLRS